MARQNKFDQLVIESTGISEPMPVAATFEWEFEDGFQLGQLAKLDTLVTVVDASTFLSEIARGEALADRDLAAAEGDARSIADLLTDQVEFADVILLNKTDLVSAATLDTLETLLRRLNPSAKLIRTDHGVVDTSEVLGTGLFLPLNRGIARPYETSAAVYRITVGSLKIATTCSSDTSVKSSNRGISGSSRTKRRFLVTPHPSRPGARR